MGLKLILSAELPRGDRKPKLGNIAPLGASSLISKSPGTCQALSDNGSGILGSNRLENTF